MVVPVNDAYRVHLPKEEAAEGHDVTWRTRAATKRRVLSR